MRALFRAASGEKAFGRRGTVVPGHTRDRFLAMAMAVAQPLSPLGARLVFSEGGGVQVALGLPFGPDRDAVQRRSPSDADKIATSFSMESTFVVTFDLAGAIRDALEEEAETEEIETETDDGLDFEPLEGPKSAPTLYDKQPPLIVSAPETPPAQSKTALAATKATQAEGEAGGAPNDQLYPTFKQRRAASRTIKRKRQREEALAG